MVSGGGSDRAGASSSSSSSGFGRGPTSFIPKPQATPTQRKQQLAQLAEMGISIPDEFRPDMAMAGDWQVTSERIIEHDEGEEKPDALALGVRKRVLGEEEQELAEAKKRRWGSTYRSHPAPQDGDLDALLSSTTRKGNFPALKTEAGEEVLFKVKGEAEAKDVHCNSLKNMSPSGETSEPIGIKREPSDGNFALSADAPLVDADLKLEEDTQTNPGVVFKKRKAKNIRQK